MFLKRCMDIGISLVGIVLASPVMIAIAIAIKLYDHGTVFYKQKRLTLGGREFDILKLLASNAGKTFSKERLYDLVWKEPYFGNENVLNTHINRLRAKIKDASGSDRVYIKTLWGIGYKIEEDE